VLIRKEARRLKMQKTIQANNKWLLMSVFGLLIISYLQWNLQLSPFTTIVSIVILLMLSFLLLKNFPINKKTKNTHSSTAFNPNAAERFQTKNSVRNIGLKLQGLGQLNLAFEKFKQCAENHNTANLMYNLSIDFQIKGEPENAKRVLEHIASFEPDFKDINQRLQSFSVENLYKPEPADENVDIEIDADIATGIDVDLELEEDLATNFEQPSAKSDSPEVSTNEISALEHTKTIIMPPSALQFTEEVDNATIKTRSDEHDSEAERQKYGEELLREYPTLYGSRFKPIELLGEGTTGAVFKGKDIVADRTVAIKVLSLNTEIEPEQLEEYKFRFYREIDTASNLNHPNIVKVYDSGETDGFAYTVMEYVNGINLRNYARADKLLHPKTVLKLIAQCADALSYAHKQHVIHRDIKPANILYNHADDYVKLTDFGIAKIPDSTRTRAGSILGTPLYMSPEQLAGEELDVRSDLYSLGVTLYHLLTGSPPFRPKTMAELLRSITNDQHKDIAEINPSTPSCIAWTVNKALEKDADKRFQSAASMANKLRECEMMLDN